MPLSLREKESFYRSLGQLLRNGSTFPKALESLTRTMGGARRRLVTALQRAADGNSVSEAFAAQRAQVSELELATLGAVERAGKLEHGCTQLAEHFRALAVAREAVLRKSAYPLFVLHLAILVFALPAALQARSVDLYVRQTLTALGAVYAVAILLFLLVPALRDFGASSSLVDRLLRALPLFGKVRRAFAVARFCRTYQMQLDAGVNVMDALEASGRASRSGLIRASVRRTVREVRNGQAPGALLAASGAFPPEVGNAIAHGEETGALDEELQRMAGEHQQEGLARLETLAEWLPRLLMLGITIYVGYGVVRFYMGYLQQAMEIMDQAQ